MKNILVPGVIGLAGGLAGGFLWLVLRGPADDPKALKADDIEVLKKRLESTEEENASLRSAVSALDSAVKRVEAAQRTAEAKATEKKAAAAEVTAATTPEKKKADAATETKTLADWLTELKSAKADRADYDRIWREIRAAKKIDDLIAFVEQSAQADAQNPDAQVDLANAYLQKIADVEGAEKGKWADKADKAFDQALALNPEHWEARFTKAVSLSFWPAFTGKPQEAVKNFETLVDQQEKKAAEPHFAQTYLILGNLYEQQGKSEKAQAIWKRGMTNFPENAEFKKKFEGAGDH